MTIIVSEHLSNQAQELSDTNCFGDNLTITSGHDLDGSTGKNLFEIGLAIGIELSDARLRDPDSSYNVWGGEYQDQDTALRGMVVVVARSEKEASAKIKAEATS